MWNCDLEWAFLINKNFKKWEWSEDWYFKNFGGNFGISGVWAERIFGKTLIGWKSLNILCSCVPVASRVSEDWTLDLGFGKASCVRWLEFTIRRRQNYLMWMLDISFKSFRYNHSIGIIWWFLFDLSVTINFCFS